MATERGLVGLGNAGESYDELRPGPPLRGLQPGRVRRPRAGQGARLRGHRHLGDVSRPRPQARRDHRTPSSRWSRAAVYNDWVAEWCSAAPDRLKGVGALPMQDPAEAAARGVPDPRPRARRRVRPAERVQRPPASTIRRTRRCGKRSRRPASRSALHITGLADMPGAARGLRHLMAPGTHHAMIPVIDQQLTLSNLVYGGVLERHPGLKVAVLECGGGWIAHWMDRLNEFVESYGWAAAPMTLDAEHYFKRQCWISFDPGERTPAALGPIAGYDRFIWASDFPHSDAKYPGVVDELRERNGDLPDDARRGSSGSTRSPCTASPSRPPDAMFDLLIRAAPSSTAPVRRRAPPTSPSRDGTHRRHRSRRRHGDRGRSTPTACSSRRASSTSTRTTTPSSTGTRPRRPLRGTASRRCSPATAASRSRRAEARGPRLARSRCSAGSRACRPTRSRPGSRSRAAASATSSPTSTAASASTWARTSVTARCAVT